MTKQISEKEFTEDVNSGMPKSKLIEKYGISSDSVKKIARQHPTLFNTSQ